MTVISGTQLNEILTKCGFGAVALDVSSEVVGQINGMITDSNEAAMFVAHLIHECGGFECREETSSGHIQLTWDDDYLAASYRIARDDERPVKDPNLCTRVLQLYWDTRVRPQAGSFTSFCATTKALHGALEPSPNHSNTTKRYRYYLKAAAVLGVVNVASE
ncbi:uncharacterized protein LOC128739436 [Sabethes cyaneus]|uniref:uncharacterized protein LOC128739436 n=1 Tax=Sabethes cyaneus TaxID=53552 RepID=UPI00237ED492|nr:uncharacterized protein LOC128739436 [Sabethes cyaneus]